MRLQAAPSRYSRFYHARMVLSIPAVDPVQTVVAVVAIGFVEPIQRIELSQVASSLPAELETTGAS